MRTCPLLALPAELRTAIWNYAVDDINPVTIKSDTFTTPALTRTNKQIRAETLPIFFSNNTFRVQVYNYRINSIWNKIKLWQQHYTPIDPHATNNMVGVCLAGIRFKRTLREWAFFTHAAKFPVLWEGGVSYDDGELVNPAVTLLQELGTHYRRESKQVVHMLLHCFWEDEKLMGRVWI